jgi:MoaA/NifB/PqqE/SkfB family radical SAM enzyme
MLDLMRWMSVLSSVTRVGQSHGLSHRELAIATQRLASSLATLADTSDVDNERLGERVLHGLRKNVEDHPALVAWVLRLAANLGDVSWDRFFNNFVLRLVADRQLLIERMTRLLGHPPPVTLVVNPTMACNLRCRGCYSFEYARGAGMEPALLRKVLSEARAMGTRFITLTGGEPFLYPHLLDVVEEFHDLTFMSYTNGTLLTDAVADRLARAGNLYPAFSVEGFAEDTDARRGSGIHAKVTAAMERLRRRGVLFGMSVTATRGTVEHICSDTFIDATVDAGASFVWVFSYIPLGRNPEIDRMPTPEQRDLLRRTTLHWRKTRPLFLGDFWNDGATCGGCLSASRYAFVTPEGNVQPCTFVPFYTHNIKDHSLVDIFRSPFFEAIRRSQPYGSNLLRSCKIIDHPHILRRLVAQFDAKPSYPGAEAIVEDHVFHERLDAYAEAYRTLADEAWHGPEYHGGHHVLVPFSGCVDVYERFPDRMARVAHHAPSINHGGRTLLARTTPFRVEEVEP